MAAERASSRSVVPNSPYVTGMLFCNVLITADNLPLAGMKGNYKKHIVL